MNFSIYPVEDAPFNITSKKIITNDKVLQCLDTQKYSKACKTKVSDGYHKPLNELCKEVNYSIADKDPKDICQYSPWNNMTRRISLVKDY
tara:strand:- start:10 stop:279 length:270 start_codon:yes stop_codon:yes gene_type:complete